MAASATTDCSPGTAAGQLPDGTVLGQLVAPYPTARGISLSWPIKGDDDADATATPRYRRSEGEWQEGTPLMRVPAGGGDYDPINEDRDA